MSLNLEITSLDHKSTEADVVAALKDLQGNILKGHGREHTAHLFLKFDSNEAAGIKAWIADLASQVTTAVGQITETERRRKHPNPAEFVSAPITLFFLSASGYQALGVAAGKQPSDGDAWDAGLKARAAAMADPVINKWDAGYRHEIHAMILLADVTAAKVKSHIKAVQAQLATGVAVVQTEIGKGWRNKNGDGLEHFGYVDGRSQPLFLKEQLEKERFSNDGVGVWSPEFPLKQVLVHDPAGTSPNSFGSYFVFRKLEQDVKKFKGLEEKLAKKLKLPEHQKELAGAMIVGRFEDGTPVVLQHAEGMHNPVPNNFDYRDDPDGTKCPFHSHIRKSNPRGDSLALGASLEEERSHIMARRGMTYGKRQANFKDQPEGEVGLLFMAYQSSISNQFEFTQQAWVNNVDFVRGNTGVDPVIGQGPKGGQACPMRWGGKAEDAKFQEFDFRGAVKMLGGEYFFAPSLSGLKNL